MSECDHSDDKWTIVSVESDAVRDLMTAQAVCRCGQTSSAVCRNPMSKDSVWEVSGGD